MHKCKICSDARRPFVRTAHKVFCSEQNYNNLKKSNNIIPQTTTESKAFIRAVSKILSQLYHTRRTAEGGAKEWRRAEARRHSLWSVVYAFVVYAIYLSLSVLPWQAWGHPSQPQPQPEGLPFTLRYMAAPITPSTTATQTIIKTISKGPIN